MTHTPIPWVHYNGSVARNQEKREARVAIDGGGNCVAVVYGLDLPTANANSSLIVRAVNSHESLLAALEAIEKWAAGELGEGQSSAQRMVSVLQIAIEAREQARAKEG